MILGGLSGEEFLDGRQFMTATVKRIAFPASSVEARPWAQFQETSA